MYVNYRLPTLDLSLGWFLYVNYKQIDFPHCRKFQLNCRAKNKEIWRNLIACLVQIGGSNKCKWTQTKNYENHFVTVIFKCKHKFSKNIHQRIQTFPYEIIEINSSLFLSNCSSAIIRVNAILNILSNCHIQVPITSALLSWIGIEIFLHFAFFLARSNGGTLEGFFLFSK